MADANSFAELIAQARSGDDQSLAELLETFRTDLLALAEANLDSGIRPKVGASDVVQESIVEARRDFGRFRGHTEVELRAWLKRVLTNNILNHYRKWKQSQKRQLKREISLDLSGSQRPLLTQPAGVSPGAAFARREEQEILQAEIDRLPIDYRDVILLRHREQLTFEEIGRRLGRSTDAARMLWYRAFERLSVAVKGLE